MRKPLLLLLTLLAGFTLQAQTAREFSTATDSLRARLRRRTTVDSYLKLKKVTKRGTALDFYFSKELGDYPWRPDDVEWFQNQLRDLTPPAYRAYTRGEIFADKDTLNSLVSKKDETISEMRATVERLQAQVEQQKIALAEKEEELKEMAEKPTNMTNASSGVPGDNGTGGAPKKNSHQTIQRGMSYEEILAAQGRK